jgi:hypothetical protein
MGIDGIKGPGASSPPSPSEGASKSHFEDALDSTVGSARAGSDVSGPLAKLQAGQIGVDEYLDLQVQDAVRHLEGKLSQEQFEFVQNSLREQLRQDPVLVELVHRTTGSIPPE